MLRGLFGRSRERSAAPVTIALMAPVSGSVWTLDRVDDPVFAQRMVGDGIAVFPESDLVVAPVAGTLTQVFPTGHAFGVTTPEGLEVLVHIGIDTVQLKGEGFTVVAEQGQPVTVNTPIVRLDLSLLKERAKSLVTPVIVTNMAKVASIERTTAQKVVGGQDVLMNVTLRRADEV